MLANAQEVSCRYHYDALDRLVRTAPTNDTELQRFYCKSRLATETQGAVQRSIFQQNDHLLAQQNQQGNVSETSLLATDQMRSIWQAVKSNHRHPFAYLPYGHRPKESGLLSLLGFNGERADPLTGHYLLGNGFRAFNPVLMRFNSPDNISPFGKGGLNSYAYCLGDPINRLDNTGHASWLKYIGRLFKPKPKVYENRMADEYEFEYANYLKQNAKHGFVQIKQVSSAQDFDFPDADNHLLFVFTRDKKLIIGWTPNPYTHGIIDQNMELTNTIMNEQFLYMRHSILGNNKKIISAGQINLDSNSINNRSGHYEPDAKSLTHVKKFLKKNKIIEIRETTRYRRDKNGELELF